MRALTLRVALVSLVLVLLSSFGLAAGEKSIIAIRMNTEGDTNKIHIEREVCCEELVKFGESIHVKKHEIVDGDVVCIGGSVNMEGVTNGDVVCMGGALKISGTVKGDAVCIGGALILDSTAVVKGDAVAIGGTLKKHDDAVLHGESVSIGIGPWDIGFPFRIGPQIGKAPFGFAGLAFGARLAQFIAVLAISVLIVLFATAVSTRLETTGKKCFWRCFLIGLLIEVCILPAIVVLIVSVVGILLIVPFLIGLLAAFFFGFAGFSLLIGNLFFSKFRSKPVHPVGAAAVGAFLIYFLGLLGGFIAMFFVPAGVPLSLLGKIAVWVAWTTGIGTIMLTRFGTRLPALLESKPSSSFPETP